MTMPEPKWPDWPQLRGGQEAFERFIFGEGFCTECKEHKQLAMVRMTETFGYRKRDPVTGGEYLMSPPRVGYCLPCAKKLAAAGRFSKKRGKK